MRQAAWVWAIGSAAEIPMVFFAGRIIRRLGLVSMLIVSMLAVSARLAVYALFPTLWAALPVQILHALAFGLFHPACIEFVRRSAPARRQGLAMALYTSLSIGLPSLVGSAMGGWIIERWGYAPLYLSYAAAPLVGVACLAATAKKMRLATTGAT
jgi:PPP family 3-phenylpropionic acid transporter